MKFLAGFVAGVAAGIVATPRWFWHVIYLAIIFGILYFHPPLIIPWCHL